MCLVYFTVIDAFYSVCTLLMLGQCFVIQEKDFLYICKFFWSQTYFVFFLSADKSALCVGSALLMDPAETLAPGHPKPPPPHLSEVGGRAGGGAAGGAAGGGEAHFKTNSHRAQENGGGWPEARQMKSSP